MPRIPVISPESPLSESQRSVVNQILGTRGGKIPAPYRFALHCPEITSKWAPLGEEMRLRSTFPDRLQELAIIIAARNWDCDYVFHAHAAHAVKGGIAPSVVDAMVRNEKPSFDKEDELAVYDYCTELYEKHAISDATYERARKLFGVPGVVELTALIGYYGMVSMTLIAHQMPLAKDNRPLVRKR